MGGDSGLFSQHGTHVKGRLPSSGWWQWPIQSAWNPCKRSTAQHVQSHCESCCWKRPFGVAEVITCNVCNLDHWVSELQIRVLLEAAAANLKMTLKAREVEQVIHLVSPAPSIYRERPISTTLQMSMCWSGSSDLNSSHSPALPRYITEPPGFATFLTPPPAPVFWKIHYSI